jgi:heme exporter protein B
VVNSTPKTRESWWSEVSAVFVKDVRSEIRTRAAVVTLLLFAAAVLMIMSLLMKTQGFGLNQEAKTTGEFLADLARDPQALTWKTVAGTSKTRAGVLSGMLWIIFFFGSMAALPRTFAKEEEMRTAAALRLAARPTAVFWGKLLFNAALSLATVILVVPPFIILMQPNVANWPLFLLYLIVGTQAISGTATLVGAMVARAGGKTYLMLPMAFPLLLAVLTPAVNGTSAAITGKPDNSLVVLVSYVVMMVTVSSFLFEKVWTDA